MKPDYSKYTYFELLDSLESIDREAFPERIEEINNELINVVEKMKALGFRLPFFGIPSDGFLKDEKQPTNLWDKLKSAFSSSDKPIKIYGNFDASISGDDRGNYYLTAVAAYMIEEKGSLNLVLRGQYEDSENEFEEVSRIKLNASNITRLRHLLEVAEEDIKLKN